MPLNVFAFLALAAAACVDPLTTKPVNTPEWDTKNIEAYGETAAGLPPEKLLGWDLSVVGDVAHWRECTAEDACTTVERTRPTKELLAVEHVGRLTIDGAEVDVLRLSLAAPQKYVVPNWKGPRR
jgi:hypothetical protein